MLAIWLPLGQTSLAALYAVSILFGFGTGSFVSLSAACVGQICGDGVYGRWLGTCYSVVSLA